MFLLTPVTTLLPHPAGLVQRHVEVPGQHPDLTGARQAVQDQTLLVGVDGGDVPLPHPVPHRIITSNNTRAENCRADTELRK